MTIVAQHYPEWYGKYFEMVSRKNYIVHFIDEFGHHDQIHMNHVKFVSEVEFKTWEVLER